MANKVEDMDQGQSQGRRAACDGAEQDRIGPGARGVNWNPNFRNSENTESILGRITANFLGQFRTNMVAAQFNAC